MATRFPRDESRKIGGRSLKLRLVRLMRCLWDGGFTTEMKLQKVSKMRSEGRGSEVEVSEVNEVPAGWFYHRSKLAEGFHNRTARQDCKMGDLAEL